MADPKWLDDLRAARDEIRLQLHLGSKEAEAEWEDLVSDWDRFLNQAQFDKSAEEVGEAAQQLGIKMKEAYDRMRKGMNSD